MASTDFIDTLANAMKGTLSILRHRRAEIHRLTSRELVVVHIDEAETLHNRSHVLVWYTLHTQQFFDGWIVTGPKLSGRKTNLEVLVSSAAHRPHHLRIALL